MVKQLRNLKILVDTKLLKDQTEKFKMINSRENVIKIDSDDSNDSIIEHPMDDLSETEREE